MEITKQYNDAQITILNIDNEPWFKGKDIATVLGYVNTNKSIRMHVDEEDQKKYANFGAAQNITPLKIDPQTVFINESGLYSLIFSSKLKTAKQFKRWVTSEVLPSIRKTGEYKINKDDQDTKKIKKIMDGINVIEKLGVNILSDRDKSFLGTQVKNLLMDDKLLEPTNNIIEYPLTRRLLDHEINYTSKMKVNLMKAGQKLRKLYIQKYNKPPPKRDQYVDNALRQVNIYTNEDFDIMDKALGEFFDI